MDIQVRFPARGYYRIYVYFGTTPLRAVATIASFLSLIFLFVALRFLRRRLAAPPSPQGPAAEG